MSAEIIDDSSEIDSVHPDIESSQTNATHSETELSSIESSITSIPPSNAPPLVDLEKHDSVNVENDTLTHLVQDESVNDELLNETPAEDEDETDKFDNIEGNAEDHSSPNVPSIENPVVDGPVEKIKGDQKAEKISRFPLGRIKDIMKSDPDVNIVGAECVFLLAKATEMFLQKLAKEIHSVTLRNKKKTLQKRDLDAVIAENPIFEFLEGALE